MYLPSLPLWHTNPLLARLLPYYYRSITAVEGGKAARGLIDIGHPSKDRKGREETPWLLSQQSERGELVVLVQVATAKDKVAWILTHSLVFTQLLLENILAMLQL